MTADLFDPITRKGESIVPPPSWPRARSDNPSTSKAAADSVKVFAGDHFRRILYALEKGGPATIHELAYRCVGLNDHQVGKRVAELAEAGKIRATGEERKGPSGRLCRVWQVVE